MIVLVRHGRTVPAQGRCIGRTAMPLSPEGREQAERLAELLHRAGLARLCSSPSLRAMDTLAPLARRTGLEPDILPGLDEIDMGQWDGVPFADIRSEFPEAYARRGEHFSDFRAPGGETFREVAGRALAALKMLAAGPLPVLAVTHAGVLRSVQCALTGHPLDDLFHFSPGHALCTLIRPDQDELRFGAANVSPQDVSGLL